MIEISHQKIILLQYHLSPPV